MLRVEGSPRCMVARSPSPPTITSGHLSRARRHHRRRGAGRAVAAAPLRPDHRSFGKLGVVLGHEGTTAVVGRGQSWSSSRPSRRTCGEDQPRRGPIFPSTCFRACSPRRARRARSISGTSLRGRFPGCPSSQNSAHVSLHPHRVIVFGNRPLRPACGGALRHPRRLRFTWSRQHPRRSVVRNAGIIQRAHPRFVKTCAPSAPSGMTG